MSARLQITYTKSSIGFSKRQKETVRTLGLRRLHQSVIVPDNPAVRGMLHHVRHLIQVEPWSNPPGGDTKDE
ncbi:MAG: 50S ribosomal protein L30 [Dehalococcoidia bacterium]|nr:50S ribosomal protein L30 [Dehalococcoidia bacterium]